MAGGGKRGKPKPGFPSFPTALGNRSAIPTFPQPRRRFSPSQIKTKKPERSPSYSKSPNPRLQAHPSMRKCSPGRALSYFLYWGLSEVYRCSASARTTLATSGSEWLSDFFNYLTGSFLARQQSLPFRRPGCILNGIVLQQVIPRTPETAAAAAVSWPAQTRTRSSAAQVR